MNSIRTAFLLFVSTSVAIASATNVDFPTYGVSVSVPEALRRIPEGNPGHVGQWGKIGSDGAPEFIIAAEASPAAGRDLQAFAKETAKAVGGSVSTEPADLGGEKAVAVVGAPTGTEMRPLGALIVEREGIFYLLTRTGKKAEDGAAEYAEIKQSWKWTPIEPPSDHLALLPGSFSAFDDLFSFRLPTLVRPYQVENVDKQLSLGIYNCQTKNQDFFLNIEVVRKKSSKSLDELGAAFAQNAKKNFQSKEPITWEKRKDGVEYLLSRPINVEMASSGGAPVQQQVVQFLAFGAESKWVIITCAISAKDEAARKAYLALIDEVGRTIAIPKKETEAATP